MTQSVCGECGEASPSGARFCAACGHFLWTAPAAEDARPVEDWWTEAPPVEQRSAEQRPAERRPVEERPTEQRLVVQRLAEAWPEAPPVDRPRAETPAAANPGPDMPQERVPVARPDGPTTIEPPPRRHVALPPEVTVADGDVVLHEARAGAVELRIGNPSSVVEGYRVEPVAPPAWLTVTAPETRLRPGDQATVRVAFGVRPQMPVVAQRVRVRLRVVPESDEAVDAGVEVDLVVPRVGGRTQLRAEPTVVRVEDGALGRFTVHLDNRGSNHPQRYVMSGADDDGRVRFTFEPEVVDVPSDSGATVHVSVTAPPPAGGRSEHSLTVRATADPADETAGLNAAARLIQETSAAPVETPAEMPVRLRLEPSALRTDDSPVAELRVVVDNRAGDRDRRVRLAGHDPENQIRFTFPASELWVPPHTERAATAQLHAPVPPPGEQADRTFTVTAGDGRDEIGSAGHWVQRSGTAPITTAAIRLDPEEVHLRDRADAYLSVLVDNRRGTRPLRLRLSGDDPENALRFAFQPAVVDVGPGQTGRADIRVMAPLAPHGEEAVRTLRVRASDENGDLEATGALRQYTSPAAITTARIVLEPQRILARDAGAARLQVRLDNRGSAFPLSANLHGTDPEQAVRFTFRPAALAVPPGQVGFAEARVSARRPRGGETRTRTFTVVADDGRGSVEATGSLVQSGGNRLLVWRVALTVLGALLVAVGCFRDWLLNNPDVVLGGLSTIPASIGETVAAGLPGSVGEAADLLRTLQPVGRALYLLLAAVMVFGLTGPRGGLTRTTGMVVALTMVAGALFWRFTGLSLADGVLMVAVGGAVGLAGGMCVRR